MCGCRNAGPIDRAARAVIGTLALILAFTVWHVRAGEMPGLIAAAVGTILLLTAATGNCPLYAPFRLSTCRTRSK